MEWAEFPIPAVVTDPGYRTAPPEVRAAYFDTAMDLWMQACRMGQPSLPRSRIPHFDALLDRELVQEVNGRVEVGWVSIAWRAYLKRVKRGRTAAKARWKQGKMTDATAMLEHSASIAPAMPSLSVCLSPSSPNSSSSSSPKRARAKQKSWLTPFAAAWEARTGGIFEFGKAAKPLKLLVERHESDAVLQAFVAYLDATEPKYLSVAHFAATFGGWDGSAPAAKVAPHKNAVEDAFAEYDARRLEVLK